MLYLTNYSLDFSCTINSSIASWSVSHNSFTLERCGRECESVTSNKCLAAVTNMKTPAFHISPSGTPDSGKVEELIVASACTNTSAFGNKIDLLIKNSITLSQKCHGMFCMSSNKNDGLSLKKNHKKNK